MSDEIARVGQENPILAASFKGYGEQEIGNLDGYIDATRAWMESLGIHEADSEDVVAIRVGVPYLGSDKTVDANTVYNSNDDVERLIATLSLDVLKVTAKTASYSGFGMPAKQMSSYTYKSPYIHRIFGNYFVDGVSNRSGFAYLDNVNVNPSKLASIPIQYNGVVQHLPIKPGNIPDYVIHCVTYLIQNPKLITKLLGDTRVSQGDMMYFPTHELYSILDFVKTRIAHKFVPVTEVQLPENAEELIKDILETLEMDRAFNAMDYGGLVNDMRLLLRIPASRANQVVLQGLLGSEDFNDVFKEVFAALGDVASESNPKADDLADVYSNSVGEDYIVGGKSLLDNVNGGFYGCKVEPIPADPEEPDVILWDDYGMTGHIRGPQTSHRFWYVSDEWLQNSTAEKIAVVFWMGLDLRTRNDNNPCPFDKMLTIVVIIAITIVTWGSASAAAAAGFTSATAATAAQTLAIMSAVVSIGMTLGVIDVKTGKKLGIALAVASLGVSWYTSAVPMGLNTETMQLTVETANIGLKIAEYREFDVMDDIEDLKTQTKEEREQAELYEESGLKIQLGGIDDRHLSWPVFEYYGKAYDRYAVYQGYGFMKS